jgi:hypothetical protein
VYAVHIQKLPKSTSNVLRLAASGDSIILFAEIWMNLSTIKTENSSQNLNGENELSNKNLSLFCYINYFSHCTGLSNVATVHFSHLEHI